MSTELVQADAGIEGVKIDYAKLRERFERRVIRGDGCWSWNGALTQGSGYAVLTFQGRKLKAHRVAYALFVGPIPEGLTLDHLCRNRGCVRPDHLEPVTFRENVLRGRSPIAAAARKTHCPTGHPYDEANTVLYQGRRYCRACGRRWSREYARRRRAAEKGMSR